DEQEGVQATLTLHYIAAVAGSPGEEIVAIAQESDIAAAAANNNIVAGTAHQSVIPLTADEDIVAGTTIHRQLDHSRGQVIGPQVIVATKEIDHEPIVGSLRSAHIDECRQARHREAGPGARNLYRV